MVPEAYDDLLGRGQNVVSDAADDKVTKSELIGCKGKQYF